MFESIPLHFHTANFHSKSTNLVLKEGVDPSVVDAQSDQVDLLSGHRSSVDGGILLEEVLAELGTVVTTVALREKGKVTALVLGEGGIEVLEELPVVRRSQR